MTTPEWDTEDTSDVTTTIQKHRNGEITWAQLVAFITDYPWHAPDLPDAVDYNGWDGPPDTFQAGTWGEVHGAFWDELLTEDEYWRLTDIFDSIWPNEIKVVKPGVDVAVSDGYHDRDVYHPPA